MSHTQRRKSGLLDTACIQAACKKINAEYLGHGTAKQYSASAEGIRVKLPGYQYPIVIDTVTGDILSDTFAGRWGKPELMDQLAQQYGVEAARAEAVKKKAKFEEFALEDGSIKCRITLGGGTLDVNQNMAPSGTSLPTL